MIETDKIFHGDGGLELKVLDKSVHVIRTFIKLIEKVLVELNLEVNSVLSMVLPEPDNFLLALTHNIIEAELEVLCPFGDRQFINDNRVLFGFINVAVTCHCVGCESFIWNYVASVVFVPWVDYWEVLSFELALYDVAQFSWIEVGDVC